MFDWCNLLRHRLDYAFPLTKAAFERWYYDHTFQIAKKNGRSSWVFVVGFPMVYSSGEKVTLGEQTLKWDQCGEKREEKLGGDLQSWKSTFSGSKLLSNT